MKTIEQQAEIEVNNYLEAQEKFEPLPYSEGSIVYGSSSTFNNHTILEESRKWIQRVKLNQI